MSCKNCQDRHLGCHSECPKYLEFRKKKDDEIVARMKANMAIEYGMPLYARRNPRPRFKRK